MANFLYWDYVNYCFYGLFIIYIVLLGLKKVLKNRKQDGVAVKQAKGFENSPGVSGIHAAIQRPSHQNEGRVEALHENLGKNYDFDREYDFERY
ncbi:MULTISPECIES: hypothetical protein [Klebsiella]|uniref:hypothetical protein n=1 Tax=Klebsiella TaxID=570 RepID=UPI0027CD72B4|nr:hypothetical protein [Klebsiella pasteurii]MDQ2202768.1 hypothetical protein [Klebsiella pasteurii]